MSVILARSIFFAIIIASMVYVAMQALNTVAGALHLPY